MEANQISLPNNATIKDADASDSDLRHDAVADQADHQVDTEAPAMPEGLTAITGPASVILTWELPHAPSIAKYQFRRKEGSGTTALKFVYTVAYGDLWEAPVSGQKLVTVKTGKGHAHGQSWEAPAEAARPPLCVTDWRAVGDSGG